MLRADRRFFTLLDQLLEREDVLHVRRAVIVGRLAARKRRELLRSVTQLLTELRRQRQRTAIDVREQ